MEAKRSTEIERDTTREINVCSFSFVLAVHGGQLSLSLLFAASPVDDFFTKMLLAAVINIVLVKRELMCFSCRRSTPNASVQRRKPPLKTTTVSRCVVLRFDRRRYRNQKEILGEISPRSLS